MHSEVLKMNKISTWFYEKEKRKIESELDLNGLEIKDPDKFYKYVNKIKKKNMIYTAIFIILIIAIIIKQLRGG